jgi:hypothetical protein
MIAEMCPVALFSIVKIQQGGPDSVYQKQLPNKAKSADAKKRCG